MVKLFLERGDVDPNSPDNSGQTPLSFAASIGHEGAVKLFLEHGDVNPDSLDSEGRAPLSYTTSRRSYNIVRLLKRASVNTRSSNSRGWKTPAICYLGGARSCREAIKGR